MPDDVTPPAPTLPGYVTELLSGLAAAEPEAQTEQVTEKRPGSGWLVKVTAAALADTIYVVCQPTGYDVQTGGRYLAKKVDAQAAIRTITHALNAAGSPPAPLPDWQAIAANAVEALRLTREYVSPIVRLAAWPGWSWFDATNTYLEAAGLPPLEQQPVPAPGPAPAGGPPDAYSPGYTTSPRGFKQLEPVPSTYAGRVRVYESSAADGPHLWLAITEPKPNDPDGPVKEAHAHLTADGAEDVALQLLWLLEHHYQGASGSARATAAIRALLPGGDPPTTEQAPPPAAADERPAPPGGTWRPASGSAPRTGWYWVGPDRAVYLPPPGTSRQIRATHPAGFRSGQWAELLGDVRVEAGGTLRRCYVVRFGRDGFIDLWPVDDPSDPYEFRAAPVPIPHGWPSAGGDDSQLVLAEVARHLERGDVLTAAGEWAPDTAADRWYRLGRRLIRRGVRRGRAQVAVYLRILMALNNAAAAGHTGARSDRATRTAPAEAAAE